jgi:hypothetical protein
MSSANVRHRGANLEEQRVEEAAEPLPKKAQREVYVLGALSAVLVLIVCLFLFLRSERDNFHQYRQLIASNYQFELQPQAELFNCDSMRLMVVDPRPLLVVDDEFEIVSVRKRPPTDEVVEIDNEPQWALKRIRSTFSTSIKVSKQKSKNARPRKTFCLKPNFGNVVYCIYIESKIFAGEATKAFASVERITGASARNGSSHCIAAEDATSTSCCCRGQRCRDKQEE